MFLHKIFKKLQSATLIFGKTSKRFTLFARFSAFFHKTSHRVGFFIKKNRALLFCLFCSFLFADLLLIKNYNFLLPDTQLPIVSLARLNSYQNLSMDAYKHLWETNMFHTGPIPLQLKEAPVQTDPILSSLAFKLKGTIIHADTHRSVATISSGSNNKTLSYQQGDIIEKQAEIKKILRAKVIFFNQNNNRLEYIIIPKDEPKFQIAYQKDKPLVEKTSSLIKRTGDNQFQVKRSDINDYMLKLPEILKQARVTPYYSERSKEIEGFRFASIDKGSIFEDLGFEKGDIIKEVDGEVITTPEKALELFDRLKGGSGFKMLVQKDGQDVYYDYSVRENAPMR